jgi:sRNA-binding regulator protein Hfq
MEHQQRREQLHTRPGFNRDRNQDRYEQRRSFQKNPKQAKGHDAILKALQESGAPVEVTFVADGRTIIGKIIARDKFTVSVCEGDETSGYRAFPNVIFKHAIEQFRQVGEAPSVAVTESTNAGIGA